MESSNKKGKTIQIKYLVIMISIAILMISTGTYLNYISNPKKLLSYAFDQAITIIENAKTPEEITGISDNYTLKSNIKFNVESQVIQNSTSPEDIQTKNFINNLNKTTNTLTITQDKTNKKMLVSINSLLNTEELLNTKYLVENSTEYYYVKGIVNNYVNNGNSNYFEALTENTTSKENTIYLLQTISKSLKKNIKNDYFIVKKEEIEINNKKKDLNKISLELNNQNTKELINNILKDLKEDTKSNRILTGLNEDILKNTLDHNVKIFDNDEKIIFNIYTTILGKIEKYELIIKDGEEEYRITYSSSTKEAYIIENNKVIYQIQCQFEENKKTLTFFNDRSEEAGKIIYDKTDNRTIISVNLKQDQNIIDIIYDSKLENIKKNTSYDNNIDLIFKITSGNDNIISMDIKLNNNVTTDLTINEDTSTAIFASSITEEQKTLLSEKIINTFALLQK